MLQGTGNLQSKVESPCPLCKDRYALARFRMLEVPILPSFPSPPNWLHLFCFGFQKLGTKFSFLSEERGCLVILAGDTSTKLKMDLYPSLGRRNLMWETAVFCSSNSCFRPHPAPFLHAHMRKVNRHWFEFPLKYLVLRKGSADNCIFLLLPKPRAVWAVAIRVPRREEESQEQHLGMKGDCSLCDPLGYLLRFLTCRTYIFQCVWGEGAVEWTETQ